MRIRQGALLLEGDAVTVIYGADGPSGPIERVEAAGNVTLVNGTDAAEAQQAVYTLADGVVVMTGDVVVTQGQNAISGQRLTLDLDTGQGVVEGRVRMILQPGGTAP